MFQQILPVTGRFNHSKVGAAAPPLAEGGALCYTAWMEFYLFDSFTLIHFLHWQNNKCFDVNQSSELNSAELTLLDGGFCNWNKTKFKISNYQPDLYLQSATLLFSFCK